jgi:MFS family permease
VSLSSLSVRPSVSALLCVNVFATTFSIGAFAPLLPEIGRTLRLSDLELGALAGSFGLARMVSDLPVGLFVRYRLRAALILGPLILLLGIGGLTMGGSFGALLISRALMGLGHSLAMVAGLTAVLHVHAGGRLGAALNGIELSGMLGLLGGLTVAGWLPGTIRWNAAFLVACSPLVLAFATLPQLGAALRQAPPGAARRGAIARGQAGPPLRSRLVPLAFLIGAAASCTYSTVEQFLIPLRGSRHFGLDRGGIAQLLQISQIVDIVALLPVGVLSDRRGARRVLAAVSVLMAGAIALIAFGSVTLVALGCALMGLAMAGWMLPLSVLREVTAPEHIAMRTALYRVGVDGAMFLGPFLNGLVGAWSPALVPGLLATLLLALGLMLALSSGDLADAPRPRY